MIKIFNKVDTEVMYLIIVKVIYNKPIANIRLDGKKLIVFPLRSRTRQRCPLSELSFNIVLQVLVRAIKQEKEVKGIQIEREEIKLSLFADDMPYIEHSKDSTKKLLELIKRIQQGHGIQIIYKNLLCFYILIANYQKQKLRKQSDLQLHQKE